MDCKFKQNLRDELNYQGITVKELSQKTGIPIRTLDNYLGKRDSLPSVDNAYLIATALAVSLDWLVSGETKTIPEHNKIENEFRPMFRDISKLPENIQSAIKTLVHYSAR